MSEQKAIKKTLKAPKKIIKYNHSDASKNKGKVLKKGLSTMFSGPPPERAKPKK